MAVEMHQALRGGAPQFGSKDPGDLLGLNPAKLKIWSFDTKNTRNTQIDILPGDTFDDNDIK